MITNAFRKRSIQLVVFAMSILVGMNVFAQSLTDRELQEMRVPLARLEIFMMTADTFPQYLRGNDQYESTIDDLFLLGFGPYETGEGTAFEMRLGNGATAVRRTEVLGETDDQSRWWRIEYDGPPTAVSFEALVNRHGVPYRVRVTDLETGTIEERKTRVGASFREAAAQMDPVALEDASEQRRLQMVEEAQGFVRGASAVGREEVTTPAGTFSTIHIVRDGGGSSIHYWVSLEVPGNLIRIATSSDPSANEIVGELVEIYEVTN